MSGGGKRAASFGYGALEGMRDKMVPTRSGPRPLLDQLDAISGVSGGSFPVAITGCTGRRCLANSKRKVEPGIGTNDFMDRVYDRTMFHGATFADLQARGRPLIAIGATDISYGTPFRSSGQKLSAELRIQSWVPADATPPSGSSASRC